MESLKHLFERNRAWARAVEKDNPGFFSELAGGQSPNYLWIGCSDSRVPASRVVDLPPGEVFVHRNIANVVDNDDASCQSVIQYAVDVLKVQHVIVCGHYGCGGVKASMEGPLTGPIDDWLQHIRDVSRRHTGLLQGCGEQEKLDLLCELNVREQCGNVRNNPFVRGARERGRQLQVHGWIYDLRNGLLRDLEVNRA